MFIPDSFIPFSPVLLAQSAWLSVLAVVALGFVLGIRHATDPDHVIAVSTIVARERSVRKAAALGAIWGLGHTLTLFVVGTAIIAFTIVVPRRLGLTLELSVAIMLLVLGVANLRAFQRSVRDILPLEGDLHHRSGIFHSHYHQHGDYVHSHRHGHNPEQHPHSDSHTPVARMDAALGRSRLYWFARPLLVGVVHGLAGSAAVALLVLATIPEPRWAVAYLLVFGVGTITGMVTITVTMASVFALGARASKSVPAYVGLTSGFASLGFGAVLLYQILSQFGAN